jgi:nucleoside-diphosphate-sugar epimerase
MEKACRGVEAVFHLAALTSVPESLEAPLAFNRVDVEGTLVALVEARRAGVRRFLLAGSCAAYGEGSSRPAREEDMGTPLSPYAAAKAAAEAYCHAFRAAFGFDAVVMRFFNVFGPRQRADSPYAAVVPRFLSALARGEKPQVFGTGEQTRDLIFVEDVASACLAVARAQGPLSPVYNVGTGRGTRVLEILERAASAMGVPAEADFLPARPGEILHSRADVSRLEREVGFNACVSFKEGMNRTAAWLRKREGS